MKLGGSSDDSWGSFTDFITVISQHGWYFAGHWLGECLKTLLLHGKASDFVWPINISEISSLGGPSNETAVEMEPSDSGAPALDPACPEAKEPEFDEPHLLKAMGTGLLGAWGLTA